MSVKDLIKGILTEKENRRYQSCLKERKITYGEWLKEQERLWIEEPQKGPSGSGLHEDDTREEFVLLCAGAGSLAGAVWMLRQAFDSLQRLSNSITLD